VAAERGQAHAESGKSKAEVATISNVQKSSAARGEEKTRPKFAPPAGENRFFRWETDAEHAGPARVIANCARLVGGREEKRGIEVLCPMCEEKP